MSILLVGSLLMVFVALIAIGFIVWALSIIDDLNGNPPVKPKHTCPYCGSVYNRYEACWHIAIVRDICLKYAERLQEIDFTDVYGKAAAIIEDKECDIEDALFTLQEQENEWPR